MGMILSRCSFDEAFSEMARLGRTFSCASRSMPGMIRSLKAPHVEEKSPLPSGSSKIRSAAISGLVIQQRLALAHENDVGLRFQRGRDCRPAQRAPARESRPRSDCAPIPASPSGRTCQSTAQPACVEMQIVWRFSSGMNTVSIFAALPSPIART